MKGDYKLIFGAKISEEETAAIAALKMKREIEHQRSEELKKKYRLKGIRI